MNPITISPVTYAGKNYTIILDIGHPKAQELGLKGDANTEMLAVLSVQAALEIYSGDLSQVNYNASFLFVEAI